MLCAVFVNWQDFFNGTDIAHTFETVLERMCITPEKSYAPEVNHRPFTCAFALGAKGVLSISPGRIPDRIFWPESIWSSHLRGRSRGVKIRCSKSMLFKNSCSLMSFWDIFYWALHRNLCCLLHQQNLPQKFTSRELPRRWELTRIHDLLHAGELIVGSRKKKSPFWFSAIQRSLVTFRSSRNGSLRENVISGQRSIRIFGKRFMESKMTSILVRLGNIFLRISML